MLAHQGEVARLAREHVEVAGEPRPGLQPADGVGDARARHAGAPIVSLVSALPGRKVMHQHAEVGAVVDDVRADAGLRGRPGVRVLRVPVDAEEAGVALA